jgi:hypothetical protein
MRNIKDNKARFSSKAAFQARSELLLEEFLIYIKKKIGNRGGYFNKNVKKMGDF